jgi:ankyrin repeat protein
VRQLIQLGAPLDLVDEEKGFSALIHASYEGHEHVVKALLDGKYPGRGATVEQRSNDGKTALGWASCWGREAVVRLLLSRGARPESQDDNGYTALHDALRGGDRPGIVALLCAAPGAAAALALRNRDGKTPLAMAVSRGHAACEAVLRAQGARE